MPTMRSFSFLFLAFNVVTTVFTAVDKENKMKADTLFKAVENGNHQAVLDTLSNSGVDVNTRNGIGEMPLHIAAGNGDTVLVEILINASAKINALDSHGAAPIHFAAFKGHPSVIDVLALNNANVNKKTPEGWTPTYIAALRGLDKVVEKLILNGADDSIASNDGKTPRDIAYKHGHMNVIDTLRRLIRPAAKACDFYRNEYTVPKRGITGDLGKESAERFEFPWMAALGYLKSNTSDYEYNCGGTIIKETFILTAAHCVMKKRLPVTVRVGETSLEGVAFQHEIQDIIRHSNYSFISKKNDIALIRLKTEIQFIKVKLYPACLRINMEDVQSDVELTVTGWGTISSTRTVQLPDLQKVQVKPMPLPECNTVIEKYNKIANLATFRNGIGQNQYCAYDPTGKNDSCQGDSGGPLQRMIPNEDIAEIVGIVSYGVSCGTGLPGIYTRVAFYLEWIESFVWPENDTFVFPN